MKNNINIEQLEKISEKIKIHIIDEELEVSNINNIFDNINHNYKTDNTKKLEELEIELINKLKKIIKNHNTNTLIIEKNIEKYKENNKNTEKIFKDLMEDNW